MFTPRTFKASVDSTHASNEPCSTQRAFCSVACAPPLPFMHLVGALLAVQPRHHHQASVNPIDHVALVHGGEVVDCDKEGAELLDD